MQFGLRKRAAPYLALTVTCLLAWGFKGHCLDGGGWSGAVQYTTGCYSDAVPFWGLRGVSAGQIPYFETPLEYPVLTGLLIWIDGAVTRTLFGDAATAGHFVAIVTLANALLALAVLWMLERAGVARSRLWAWAVAPPLVLYLGHNWDMLAIALGVAAMLLAARDRPVAAAAMAGLGVAAKLFPVLLIPILGLHALFGRSERGWPRRVGTAAAIGAAAVAAWAAVNLPVALAAFENWSEFYRFSAERSGTAASIWEVAATQGWLATTIPERNRLAGAIFVFGTLAILAAGWPRHGRHGWVLWTPVLAWFMLTNKVYSPQFDLWLYPMLLLTLRRPGPIALFALGDLLAYFAEFWWFAGLEGGWPAADTNDIAAATGVRAAAMLWAIGAALWSPPPHWIGERRTPIEPTTANA